MTTNRWRCANARPTEALAPAKVVALAITALMASLSGCTPPIWQRAYVAQPGLAATSAPAVQHAPLRVRQVPWERVAVALDADHQARVDSEIPPDQWPADKTRALDELLLRQLQFPDPSRVALLGRSLFVTTDFDTLPAGELSSFAQRIQAHEVVYAKRPMGDGQRIDREWVFYDRFDASLYHHAGPHRSVFPERTATSVPVVRTVPQTQFAVFWLRANGP